MKKMLLVVLSLVLIAPVYAIEWVGVISQNGRMAYVDKDSIQVKNGYYFYNIKFANKNPQDIVVLTMQSGLKSTFSARIKSYTPFEYDRLQGDYENIAQNMTENLEPVTFDSLAYACYKKVKELQQLKNSPQITF